MKKIRDGESGEVTAEIFETWFPDKPELLLLDFLRSDKKDIFYIIPMNSDVMICHITKKYAQKLLDEFKEMRKCH